ncbi:hypothetical protein D9M70_624060 [compost metagenome]
MWPAFSAGKRVLRLEPRQIGRHVDIDIDQALFGQLHDCQRGEGLGDRADAEAGVLAHVEMAVVTLDMAFGEHAISINEGVGDRRDRLVLDLVSDQILEKLDGSSRQRGHGKCSFDLKGIGGP